MQIQRGNVPRLVAEDVSCLVVDALALTVVDDVFVLVLMVEVEVVDVL